MRRCSDTNIDPVTLWKDTKIILMVEGISLARRGLIAVFFLLQFSLVFEYFFQLLSQRIFLTLSSVISCSFFAGF